MINIALYQPDIPQNTAAIIRLGACLGLKIHIIEPCGFNIRDKRFQRVAMDYIKLTKIIRYDDYIAFTKKCILTIRSSHINLIFEVRRFNYLWI